MNVRFPLLALVLAVSVTLFGQKDPVLFSVNGLPVHQSEFQYIYEKTNGDQADYSRASLDEYLDLYLKFKLKVARAREMQLDTVPELRRELNGYRRQLADSYLLDKEVTDRLAQELFDRQKQDVDISHVLVTLPQNATPADTLAAFKTAMTARQRLQAKEDFATVAKELSQDKSVARNGGHIGYVTAPFPAGYYPLETAAYSQRVGSFSMPIRTAAGYHVLTVHDRRPARGQVEIAHLLVRAEGDAAAAEKRIREYYDIIQSGNGTFEEVTKRYSQDKKTAPRNGYLGVFGINRYETAFEDAAFALANDGDISEPVKTSAGWHLLKRVSKKDPQDFRAARGTLVNQIKKDPRYELARRALIDRIKTDAGFVETTKTLDNFADTVSQNFMTFKWKPGELANSSEVLFGIGDTKVTLAQFMDYLERSSRKRIRIGKRTPAKEAVRTLYAEFVDEQVMAYEERQLEKQYPEFKALMREYEEGILLFEATKLLVWDKASQDTTGLKEFFATTDKQYNWEERAEVTEYTVNKDAAEQLSAVRTYAQNHTPQEVVQRFNNDSVRVVSYMRKTYERGTNEAIDQLTWKAGTVGNNGQAPRNGGFTFAKIERILPAGPKSLDDARGYVIADYQDYLEREWVESLRQKYDVEVNEKVLKNMSKKK